MEKFSATGIELFRKWPPIQIRCTDVILAIKLWKEYVSNIIDPNNYIEKTQIVKQKWSKSYCIRWELGFKKNVKKYNTQELYVNSNPEYQIFPLNYFGCSPLIFHHNHCKIFIFLIHVSLAGKNQVNIHILKILRLFHWIKKTDIPYSCLKITI